MSCLLGRDDSFSCIFIFLKLLNPLIVFFSSRIFVFNGFYLLNFSFCSRIIFLILFIVLCSCSSLKRIILNSLTVCRSLFTSVIFGVVSSDGVIFSFSWPLIPYVCVCTVEYLDFSYSLISLLSKRQIFPSQLSLGFWACLLIVSLGKWSLLLWSHFLRDNCLSSEVGNGGMCHWIRTVG